ncbi:MAG: hypothetical protein ACK2T1_09185 [Candidatus Promineifilaceae bacterium]|jgi:hypothetical protein
METSQTYFQTEEISRSFELFVRGIFAGVVWFLGINIFFNSLLQNQAQLMTNDRGI